MLMTEEFGKSDEMWDWENFKTTEGFPISKELIDWVIGQEKAIRECKLCIDEWIAKLEWLRKKEWWKSFEVVEEPNVHYLTLGKHKLKLWTSHTKHFVFNPKAPHKEFLPAGPFLLLVGDAGTGKSLIGRAMATYLTEVYKKYGVSLYDVCSWFNKRMPSEPKISIHPTPKGAKIVEKAYAQEEKKGRFIKWGMKALIWTMLGFGGLVLGYVLGYQGIWTWATNSAVSQTYSFMDWLINGIIMPEISVVLAGIMCMSMGAMLYVFSKMFGMVGGTKKGIGGAENTKAPKLLIDNSLGVAPFIDATGHGSSQLFGSIAWDPYQTGDLGTPEHQRVTAGDVHRAHLGILYIDEIKNLYGAEATTLLTVLEDGQLPIALRSHSGMSGDTAAMAVATEAVPCMVFLIAAGNMDSVPQIHPALMDRIYGYGKVVYMNNDMPNTPENKRKYVQFMAQEIHRFNLLPFTREACLAIVAEARRKSGLKEKLTCKFRPMISIIKTASTLARNDGKTVVDACYIHEAISEHCKSVYQQVLERQVEFENLYKIVNPNDDPKEGQIYCMSVQSDCMEADIIGCVSPLKASIVPIEEEEKEKENCGYFTVTGVNETEGSWVQNSIAKVRHVFIQMFKKDPAMDFKTHIDFAQELGVDGPSAGAAMALTLISAYTKKKSDRTLRLQVKSTSALRER